MANHPNNASPETLCEKCKYMKRVSTGLRICKCGAEMTGDEIASCTGCAEKNGTCRWCGKSTKTPTS